ncbi:MAG TPA: hypothetical protein VIX12_01915 [Candidatus Binataceae bacterium]
MIFGEPLTQAQRRYLLVDNGVGAFIINFIIAGVMGWLIFRNSTQVPLWGRSSIAGDTIGTSILLPLITCLIVTPIARSQIRAGRLVSLRGGRASNWFPRNTFLRGLLIGALSLLALMPITLLGLRVAGVDSMSLRHFLLFKTVFAALEAALVTPFLALLAISSDDLIPERISETRSRG